MCSNYVWYLFIYFFSLPASNHNLKYLYTRFIPRTVDYVSKITIMSCPASTCSIYKYNLIRNETETQTIPTTNYIEKRYGQNGRDSINELI